MAVCARRNAWILAALGAGILVIRRRRAAARDLGLWISEPPSDAPNLVRRDGSPADRGSGTPVQFDLTQAQQHHLEPVVQFLTYLQEQRGDRSHLLFVRYDDLDALAAQDGTPVAEFLSRLDQLGVVISQN